MISVNNLCANGIQLTPAPPFRYLKWHVLIMGLMFTSECNEQLSDVYECIL